MDHAISLVIFTILLLVGFVLHIIGIIDGFLAALMTAAHVPPNAQLVLLLVAAIWLAILAFRALGGVFGALIIVLLVLMLLHKAMPNMQMPQYINPPAAAGHTTI